MKGVATLESRLWAATTVRKRAGGKGLVAADLHPCEGASLADKDVEVTVNNSLAQDPMDGLRKAFKALNPESTEAEFLRWTQKIDDEDDYGEEKFAEFADLCNACLTAFLREGEPDLNLDELYAIGYAEGHFDTKRHLLNKISQRL